MSVHSVALNSRLFTPGASRLTSRRNQIIRILPLLLWAWCCSTAVLAQTADDDVVRVSTDLSVFPIRVTDKNRHAVPGLKVSDFQLQDRDGITTSMYFAAGADRVALVFALDQSGSLREVISQQRDAAVGLFEHFSTASRVAVIRFAEKPETIVAFGKDSQAARAAFDFSPGINRHTAIFDAALAAVRAFDNSVRDPAERRIVILVSDGLDNSSMTSPARVIAAAQEQNISFYTIQIPLFEPRDGRLQVRGPAKGFRELGERTGGKYFLVGNARDALEPAKSPDLYPVFKAIEEDLRSQYVVGFYVGERARDDRTHQVSINISRPGLVYSVAQYGYARTHQFSIKLSPRDSGKPPG